MPISRSARYRLTALVLGAGSLFFPIQPAAAAGPRPGVPRVGDTLSYAVSTGERVVLTTTRVRQLGRGLVATELETVRYPGEESRTTAISVIRTDDALAFEFAPSGSETLSPLVYFFAPALPHDSWLAQRVSYVDARGRRVAYKVIAQVEAIETVASPAGTFPGCWRLDFSSTANPGDRLEAWLEPDLGIVRTQSEYRGRSIVTELTGFHLAEGAGRPVNPGLASR